MPFKFERTLELIGLLKAAAPLAVAPRRAKTAQRPEARPAATPSRDHRFATPRNLQRFGMIVTYALLAIWAWICLFPLYWTAATSLKGALEIVGGPYYFPFVDYTPSLDAWAYILGDSNDDPLLRYSNSVLVGLTSASMTVFFGAMAVYGLTRFRLAASWVSISLVVMGAGLTWAAFVATEITLKLLFVVTTALFLLLAGRLNRFGPTLRHAGILIAILSTRILPPVVVVLPIYLMAQFAGMLDTRFALTLTYTAANLPVAVWLLQPVLGEVATDQEEAAQLDGASHLRIFLTIAVPLAAPGIVVVGLLVFILCWNEYLFSVYLADNHAMTMPPFLAAQMSVREQQAGSDAEEWTRLCAAIILMATPLILFAGFAQRFLARIAIWSR